MRSLSLSLVLAASFSLGVMHAAGAGQAITREATQGPNGPFPIAQSVRVPAGADMIYLSGMTGPVVNPTAAKDSVEAYGDTETQVKGAIERIQGALKTQGLTLADVVFLHVYLVGDPNKGGKLDFAGLQAAYTKYFGTAEQPNKPARTTVQVSALAGPGMLAELEATAAKLP